MTFLILYQCTNCHTTDFSYFAPCVDELVHLEPSLESVEKFIKSAYFGQHFFLLQIICHSLIAVSTEWNAQSEMIFGLILGVLLCETIARSMRHQCRTRHNLQFSLALLFVFGTTNTSVFLNGQPAISAGLVLLCYSLIICLATKESASACDLIILALLLAVSAVLGSYLFTVTLAAVILCATLLNRRFLLRPILFGTFSSVVIIAAIALMRPPMENLNAPLMLRPTVFLSILARPFFANLGTDFNVDNATIFYGIFGLLWALMASVAYLLLKRTPFRPEFAASLSFILFGAAMAFIISLGRSTIAPWYSIFAQMFWLGLLALTLAVLRLGKNATKSNIETKRHLVHRVALVNLTVLAILYAVSNISFQNKDWYASVHGPVSASVLRHYQTAPTYGENFVNCAAKSGPLFLQSLAEPLRKNSWSAFSSRQVWHLQGDYLLSSVRVASTPDGGTPFWILKNDINRSIDFKGSRRLNLYLCKGSAVEWELEIPATVQSAYFVTRLMEKPIKGQGFVRILDSKRQLLVEHSLKETGSALRLNLSTYANSTIFLRIIGSPQASGLILKEPRVEIMCSNQSAKAPSNLACHPSNISRDIPSPTEGNCFKFNDVNVDTQWLTAGLALEKSTSDTLAFRTIDTRAFFQYKQPLSIPASKIKEVALWMCAHPQEHFQADEVLIQFSTDKNRIVQALLPIPTGKEIMRFSYQTRAIGFAPGEKITGIKLLPALGRSDSRIELKCFALVHSHD